MSTFSKNKEGIVFPNCKERLNFKALQTDRVWVIHGFPEKNRKYCFFQNIKYQKSLFQDLVKETHYSICQWLQHDRIILNCHCMVLASNTSRMTSRLYLVSVKDWRSGNLSKCLLSNLSNPSCSKNRNCTISKPHKPFFPSKHES